MRTVFRDIRYAVRSLAGDRGFTITVVLTIAVCIAVNAATFALVNSVLLRPLPVPDARSILILSNRYPKAGADFGFNAAIGDYKELLINAGFHTVVSPLEEMLVGRVRSSLYLLWGGAAFVLLIGAVNVANLVLARTSLRRKEFATRLALGAGAGRLTRQLVTESILVAVAGGAAGPALGTGLVRALARSGIERLARAG